MADQKRSAPARWMRVALVVSLALNLAVAGLMLGRALDGQKHPPRGVDLSLGPWSRALGDEDRRAVRDHFRKAPQRHREAYAERRARDAQVIAAIRAVPFDPTPVAAHLAQRRSFADSLLAAGHGAILARLSAATDAERAEFADRLEAELAKVRRPGKRGPDRN